MKNWACLVLIALGFAACARLPMGVAVTENKNENENTQKVPAFSASSFSIPNYSIPKGWLPLRIMRTKADTDYKIVQDEGLSVLQARAIKSASGLIWRTRIPAAEVAQLKINWRWKIKNLIEGANLSQRGTDDSPVRIVLSFDGDKSTLSYKNLLLFDTVKLTTGNDMPYATLMYSWDKQIEKNAVIGSTHTNRVQMWVAESGASSVGKWQSYERDIAADFRAAFEEEPGDLIGIGILSDTDNTGQSVEAWYGDISLEKK